MNTALVAPPKPKQEADHYTRTWVMVGFSSYAPFNVFYGSLIHATHAELKAALKLIPSGIRHEQIKVQLPGGDKCTN